jgi:beta-galactosidase
LNFRKLFAQYLFVVFVLAIAMALSISAAPVPLTGSVPVALDKLRPGNPAVLSMNGTWRFKLEHGMSPAENGVLRESTNTADDSFAASGMGDADWKDIPVPANWEIEGFSRPTFQDRGTNASDDIGLYRRWIDVPENFAGQQVLWHFDGVYDGAEIFVNGLRVGYHESGFTAFDVDVTRALRPGKKNLFALRVYKKTPSGTMDKGDFWCLGGIYRDNYLVALPPLHVDDITIVTDLDTNYLNATLNTTVHLAGQTGAWFNVTGKLYGFDGRVISTPPIQQTGRIGPDGISSFTLQTPVKSPKLWSAEKPNLYYVLLQLDDHSRTTERVQERFGFRKIENRNGVLLWNGMPIKCTGVCRHEEFSPYGHALTEQCWETDVALMKAANINAIRTSHYNHSARFLELCDEAGFYVLDEVPFCWVAADPQFNLRNTNAVWAFLLRSKETLARDKNRPCILAWSIGNESGYGPNAQSAFDYMKSHDLTRPAFISQQGLQSSPLMDFDDAHYPSLANLRTMATNRARCKVPLILTEEPHTFCTAPVVNYDYGVEDLWGQALVNIWDIVWPTDAIVGSFVWEWQDQGMSDKFPDRSGVDPVTGMRDENNKGIVTTDRKLKPAYWHLKMVYSPITTAMREVAPAGGQCVVLLQNRYSFTDLSELTCRWQTLTGEKELAHGVSHIECKPRSSTNATFPVTPGMDTLRLEFIHPDGRSIYVVRLHTPVYQPPVAPLALVANDSVKLSETDKKVLVQVAGTKLTVDKQTGQISSWRAAGQNLVIGGPILNLGEDMEGGRSSGRRGQGSAGRRGDPPLISSSQPPQLKNAAVKAKMEGAVAKISVTADVYLAGKNELKGQLTYTFEIGADAQANVAWNLLWKAPIASASETGLKFLLPANTDTMSWFCDSLWTDYPADHIGKPEGTVTSKDISFRSSKRNVHWMTLSGAGKYSLVALRSDNKPLAARGRPDANGTTLFLTSAIEGPAGELSLNSVPGYEILLTPDTSIGGAFQLRIATKKVNQRVSTEQAVISY